MTAFFCVNGVNMPIADGSLKRSQDVGPTTTRALDGTAIQHASAHKIVLAGAVPPSTPMEGAAWAGLLTGRGHVFHFDADGSALDIYSARGLYPDGTPVVAFRRSTAPSGTGALSTDDIDVATHYDVPKFGTACLHAGLAATNLLTANQADGTDTSATTAGFTSRAGAGTSTLTSSTSKKYRGTHALLCEASAHVAVGWETDAYAGFMNLIYVGSVFLLASSGTPTVDVWVRDESQGTDGTKIRVTLSTTVWRRVEVMHSTGGAADPHSMKLIVETAGTTGDGFYADELMLVAAINGSAGPWVAGGASRNATSLIYTLTDLKPTDDFTIMMWIRHQTAAAGAHGYDDMVVFQLGDSITNAILMDGLGGDDRLSISSATPATTDVPYLSPAWQHIVVVCRRDPPAGAGNVQTYTDGVALATKTCVLPVFTTTPMLSIGCDLAAARVFEGMIDEVVVVPWAMSAEQIAGWYARVFSSLPRLDVSGAVVAGTTTGGPELEMVSDSGSLDDAYVQATSGGVHSSLHRALGFKLFEV